MAEELTAKAFGGTADGHGYRGNQQRDRGRRLAPRALWCREPPGDQQLSGGSIRSARSAYGGRPGRAAADEIP